MSDVEAGAGDKVPQGAETSVTGPGAQLAAQRQAVGWTIEQVANQLNLAPRQVQALEEDNYAVLPGMVIARGFLRAYAKLLRLDPATLLAMIAEQPASAGAPIELRRALSASFTESELPVAKRGGGRGKWFLLLLLLAALAAAGWHAWQQGWLAQLGVSSESMGVPAQTHEAPRGEVDGNAPADQPDLTASAEPGDQAPAVGVSPAPTQLQAQPQPELQPQAQAQPQAAPASAAADTAAADGDNLVLTMRQESWVEVTSANGTLLAARLVAAGATESFKVAPGATLVLGNAAGVDVKFRGTAVAVPPADIRNNVARIKLK